MAESPNGHFLCVAREHAHTHTQTHPTYREEKQITESKRKMKTKRQQSAFLRPPLRTRDSGVPAHYRVQEALAHRAHTVCNVLRYIIIIDHSNNKFILFILNLAMHKPTGSLTPCPLPLCPATAMAVCCVRARALALHSMICKEADFMFPLGQVPFSCCCLSRAVRRNEFHFASIRSVCSIARAAWQQQSSVRLRQQREEKKKMHSENKETKEKIERCEARRNTYMSVPRRKRESFPNGRKE